jgi:hypothetical protein
MMFLPGVAAQTHLKPLPTTKCTVHLILADDQARESIYPCGEWFQPPIARYLEWLEEPGFVSYQRVVGYAGEPFHGKGMIGLNTLTHAAAVSLVSRIKLNADETFRLVSLTTEGDSRLFDRRITPGRVKEAFQVPAGNVIGGIFNSMGRAIALTGPISARLGQTVAITPHSPVSGGDAMVVIDRTVAPHDKPDDCAFRFAVGKKELPPAVNVITRDRLLFIWYGLNPGSADFTLRCGGKTISRQFSIVAKNIVTYRDELQ